MCAGAEFPLLQGLDGVSVQLRIEPSDDLNAVDRSVLADDGVEHHLALHVRFDQLGRIFRIRLCHRARGTPPDSLCDLGPYFSSSSAKSMIQLPLALVRFGRLTCSVYTSLPERIFSGGRLGSRFAHVCRTPSCALEGSYGVIGLRFSRGGFPTADPSAFPPSRGCGGAHADHGAGRELPPAPPAPRSMPAALPEPPPLAPETLRALLAPGVPGFPPSGEIEMRAARFPSGTLTWGAGGAGVAESAIKRRTHCIALFALRLRPREQRPRPHESRARRAAMWTWHPAAIFGCAIVAGDGAISMGPGFFSAFATRALRVRDGAMPQLGRRSGGRQFQVRPLSV